MADLSIIELVVYGIITYSGMVGLILSAFKDSSTPQGEQSQSATRVIWLIPSIFTAFILASSGAEITLTDNTVDSVLVNLNTTEAWSETVTTNQSVTLVDPVWTTVHFLFFIILLVYVLINIVSMLVRK